MTVSFDAVEQDLVEREVRARGGGNSGALAAKRELWTELGASLQNSFQNQLDRMADGKLPTIDLKQICEAFGLQQGAMKNKIKGYAVTIVMVRGKPKVEVRWISDKTEARVFIKLVNAQNKDAPRLLGGLSLTRTINWEGKNYPVTDMSQFTRNEEDSKRFYVLSIGKFWYSGSPTTRST